MNLMFRFFKYHYCYNLKDSFLPELYIGISGSVFNYGQIQHTEFFQEEYREWSFTFPLHILWNKHEDSWNFSIGCGLVLTVAYQWNY